MNNSIPVDFQDSFFNANEASFYSVQEQKKRQSSPLLVLGIMLPLVSFSTPIINIPATEIAKPSISRDGLSFSPFTSVTTKATDKHIGRSVSRQEAFAITRRILQKAEQARIEAAEIEVQYGIPWNSL